MKTNTRISQRKITPADLPAMLEASPFFVLYVGQPTSAAEGALAHFDELAGVGWLAPQDIHSDDAWTRLWIRAQRAHLGWPAASDVPAGYYLFIGGKAAKYESGTVDFDNDRASLVLGLGTAAIALAVDPMSTNQALALVHAQAAQRVVQVFDRAIDVHLSRLAKTLLAMAKASRSA